MDTFNEVPKFTPEPTPQEKMSSVIDLAVGRLKIPSHKRDHFFQEIKNLAKRLADKNTGDDDIRNMITSHVLPELPMESDRSD
jgi:hypothetical protein